MKGVLEQFSFRNSNTATNCTEHTSHQILNKCQFITTGHWMHDFKTGSANLWTFTTFGNAFYAAPKILWSNNIKYLCTNL